MEGCVPLASTATAPCYPFSTCQHGSGARFVQGEVEGSAGVLLPHTQDFLSSSVCGAPFQMSLPQQTAYSAASAREGRYHPPLPHLLTCQNIFTQKLLSTSRLWLHWGSQWKRTPLNTGQEVLSWCLQLWLAALLWGSHSLGKPVSIFSYHCHHLVTKLSQGTWLLFKV